MQLTRGSMSRRRPAEGPLQITWLGGEALAWQPGTSPARWNQLATALAMTTGIYPSGGYLASRALRTPDGIASVHGYRLPPSVLLQLPISFDASPGAGLGASPSVRWFAALADAVRGLLRTGRVVPVLDAAQGHVRSRWAPVLDPPALAVLERLDAWRPPVAIDTEVPTTATDVCAAIIEHVVEPLLREASWRAELPTNRDAVARVARVVHKLLDGRQPLANLHDQNERATARGFAIAFQRIAARDRGEPVVAGRVRLSLPDDPAGPWPLAIELSDVAAADRWCTAAALAHAIAGADPAAANGARSKAPAAGATGDALRLAGDAGHLPLLAEEVERVRAAVTAALGDAELAWADGVAELDVDGAAVLLESMDDLAEASVEVLVPSSLARRSPSVSATAAPADHTPSGRLGRTALVSWNVDVDGAPVDDEVIHRALQAGGSLVQVGGRWVRLDAGAARRALAAVAEHRAVHGELSTIELLRLAAELDAEAEAEAAEHDDAGDPAALIDRLPPVRGTDWLGPLLEGLPDATLADGEIPSTFAGELRHYQRRGLGWLQFLDRVGLGGCLADDMGLGKTSQALAHLAGREGPHLVVCPLSVVRNWQREAARFTPLQRVLVHHGAGRVKDDRLLHAIAEADIVITTYQLLARDLETLASVAWGTVVLDEAQTIKNAHTKAARAARHLHAGQVVALTGTPVENRLGELWSILDVTTPGLLGSERAFKERFAQPIERDRDATAVAALRTLTSPFVLRRTKADKQLVPELPDKIEQIAWAPLTREQAAMYQGVVDQLLLDAQQESGMRRRGLVLASLTRLKQICNHPVNALADGSKLAGRSGKLARFDELIDGLLEADERALVFTQFKAMGDLLARHLEERSELHVPFLHGGVSKQRRDAMVDRFQEGAGSPLLLVSLKAGGTGLNLTAASRVVHYDRWWNPAVEDQATDRAWRIGQTRSVFVHKLVCQGTIEEKVAALIDDKRALADAVVGSTGEGWLSELSTDELRELIVLDPSAREDAG